MGSVAVGSKACNFRIYFCTALVCVLHVFQNQGSSALAYYKSVALCIKRLWLFLGVGVVVCGCTHCIKGRCVRRDKFFCTACHHHVLNAVFDGFVCVADCLAAGSACRVGGDYSSAQGIEDAYVCSTSLGHTLYVGLGIYLA